MTKHKCSVCGWEPPSDSLYPEDRIIGHYDDEHKDTEDE